jgi:hypothetical protein
MEGPWKIDNEARKMKMKKNANSVNDHDETNDRLDLLIFGKIFYIGIPAVKIIR